MLRTVCAATLLALLGLSAQPAKADLILSPTAVIRNDFGVTPPDSAASYGVENMINQVGLLSSAGFTSGVTNYDAYVAGAPSHDSDSLNGHWLGEFGAPTTGVIDFDLGENLTIDSVGFWSSPLRAFDSIVVKTSRRSDFATFAEVGTFEPFSSSFSPPPTVAVQDIALERSWGRYVRFEITEDNPGYGPLGQPGIGEVAFEVSAVPEPTTLPLLIGGAAGVFFLRRRLKKRAQS